MAPRLPLSVLAITAEQTGDAARRVVIPLTRLCEAHPGDIEARFAPSLGIDLLDGVDVLLVRAAELPDIKLLADARNRGARVVVDLSHHPAFLPKNLGSGLADTTLNPQLGLALSMCERVIVSSEVLAHQVAPFNRRISVVGTFVDIDLWSVPRPKLTPDDPIALCWLGGPNTDHDLGVLGDSLQRLLELRPHSGVVSFSDFPSGVATHANVWRYPPMPFMQLPGFLSGISVGIVPRVPGPVSESSTPGMAIELLALGVPVVVSPTPEHQLLAERSPHVHIAESPESWLSHLLQLVDAAAASPSPASCPSEYALSANLTPLALALFQAAGNPGTPWMSQESADA